MVVEAAGVVPSATFEERRSKPRRVADARPSEARDGGGGGSRTLRRRVSKLLMARVFWLEPLADHRFPPTMKSTHISDCLRRSFPVVATSVAQTRAPAVHN